MRKGIWTRRAICLLLAVQMLCAPLAQAAPLSRNFALASTPEKGTVQSPPPISEPTNTTVVTPAEPAGATAAPVPTAGDSSEAVGAVTPTVPSAPAQEGDVPPASREEAGEETAEEDKQEEALEEETTKTDNEGTPAEVPVWEVRLGSGEELPPVSRVEVVYGFHPFAVVGNSSKVSPLRVEGSAVDSNGKGAAPFLGETFQTIKVSNLTYQNINDVVQGGRVPDRKFEGWYLLPLGSAEQSKKPDDIFFKGDLSPISEDTVLAEIPMKDRWEANDALFFQTITIIGKWTLSDNALARAEVADAATGEDIKTALYPVKDGTVGEGPIALYTEDIATKTNGELEGKGAAFDPQQATYYLRVPADVTAVKLDMLAAESFRFWRDTAPGQYGISVQAATVDGQDKSYPVSSQFVNVAEGEEGIGNYTPVNSAENPACSLWTTNEGNDIPLTPSQGEGNYYNVVTVTITAPDGVTTKTYTFHIQRLTEPRLEQNPGNTPYGMIEGDAKLSAEAKAEAKTQFETNWKLPGSLSVEGMKYFQGAYWGDENGLSIDRNPHGLVAYLGDSFREPGVTLYNSVGDPVAGEEAVAKELEVSTVETLTTDVVLKASAGAEKETVTPADGLWTLGRNVIPGTYQMQYRCTDPITGEKYTSESAFVGTEDYAKTFAREVTVLPLPGDVDMDGVVTPADGYALKTKGTDSSDSLFETLINLQSEKKLSDLQKLFLYRVCDVADIGGKPVEHNGGPNGLLEEGDISALYNGFVPSWHTSDWYSLFYTPLEGARTPQKASGVGAGAGKLSLDYLGQGETPADKGIATEGQQLKKGDLFWVGVRISDWEGSGGLTAIRTISASLTYDGTYLAPAVWTQDGFVPLNGATEADWQATMERYNLYNTADGADTVWPTGVTWMGGSPADRYVDYDTKAETTVAGSGQVRELKVSFQMDGSAGVPIKKDGQWLVKVPFILVEQPQGDSVHALDLSLGSGNLAALLTDSNEAQAATLTVAWEMDGWLADKHNMAKQMSYDRSTATSATTLYLAPDGVVHTLLGSIPYGDEASLTGSFGQNSIDDEMKLPPGMTYDSVNNLISGTPQETGVFRFYIGGKAYQINVTPAQLEIWPEDKAKYYGEDNPLLTFRYNTEQIKAIDRPGGANNPSSAFLWTGAGEELKNLSGHKTAGALTTRAGAQGAGPVERTTPAEEYDILLQGWENEHYSFVFKDSEAVTTSTDDNCGQAVLRVMRRPVVAAAITAYPVEVIRVDADKLTFEKTAVLGGGTENGFVAALPDMPDGLFQGYPLTGTAVLEGESLTIGYKATFTPDSQATGSNKFVLTQPQEDRTVAVTGVGLVETEDSVNYQLNGPYPTQAEGRVVDRNVAKIEFVDPYSVNGLSNMEYTYGDTVSFAGLTLKLTFEAEADETPRTMTLAYQTPESLAQYGLKAALLDAPENMPGKDSPPLKSGASIDYNVHHGKYFCVWLETGLEDETKVVWAASRDPFTVKKRLITITPNEGSCFYGEDPNSEANGKSLGFRYTTDSLTDEDLAAANVRREELTGSGQELAAILTAADGEYTPPSATIRYGVPTSGNTELVEAGAKVSPYYFAVMSGAEAKNYSFQYTQYENQSTPKAEYGTRYYAIRPRPIVVDQVTMSTASDASGYFLYDDTAENRLETMYRAGPEGQDIHPTATGVKTGGAKDSFTASVPKVRIGEGDALGYYPAGGSVNPVTLAENSLTGDALFDGDEVRVQYIATYEGDGGITNGNPHFQLPEGEPAGLRDVAISDLKLVGENASNYVLVYTDNGKASTLEPQQAQVEDTGLVKLRPIKSMEVESDPKAMDYTYGQTLNLEGMELKLTYETAGDNTGTYKPVKSLSYRRITLGEGENQTVTDSFAQLGFRLKWETGEDDVKDYAPFQTAAFGSLPTVAEHSGRKLVVYGRRHVDHESLESATAGAVTIEKKALNLTVTSQSRFYGVENAEYAFAFDAAQLSDSDAGLVGGARDAAALAGLTSGLAGKYFAGYKAPSFAAGAEPASGVGSYPLTLSGGSMDNYFFTYTQGTITVEKRPIRVTAITGTSADQPIQTIFYNEPKTDFTTSIDSDGTPGFTAYPAHGSLAGTTALYGDDALRLVVNLRYPEAAARPELNGASTVSCGVTVTGVALASGGDNDNYVLESETPTLAPVTGRLDNRKVKELVVTQLPTTNYLYGQSMDLSAMKVRLNYEDAGNTSEEVIAERDDRVKVYYSDSPRVASVAGLTEVKSGDHLTIAPYGAGGLSHQDKYLVVQATQVDATPPQVVQKDGTVARIKITPLDLTYRLTAEGKVYDGTTRTNGTITLTNRYGSDDVEATAQFDFLDANVKYESDGYTKDPGDAYWTGFQADPVRDSENWHEGREAAAMPVLLSGIQLSGAQAGNYTLALTTGELNAKKAGADDPTRGPVAVTGKIGLTDNSADSLRDKVPFATIRRADREMPEAAPRMSVDDHTNVVRVDYDEENQLRHTLTTSADKNNRVPDDYAAETHFEYVLEGKKGQEPVFTWAGLTGGDASQDTRFFGGEAVTPDAPVPVEGEGEGGFVPDVEDFPDGEELTEEGFVFQGQTYRWAEEDEGFVLDKAAYPGGEDYVRPGYELYTTQRDPLPRGATLWAGVRVAATHNYNASDFRWSVEGDDKDQRAAAAQPIADEVSRERLNILNAYGEEKKWPQEDYLFQPGLHGAVNAYTQRLDLISVEEQESKAEGGGGGGQAGKFKVDTLEAVWFTDLLDYPKQDYMDGAVRNDDPVRYRGYYWDEEQSAELDFEGKEHDEAPLSLKDPLEVLVKVKENEAEVEKTVTVNVDNTATIYVNTRSGGGSILEQSIAIEPSALIAYLEDEPVRLTVRFTPAYTTIQTVIWTSSDPSVATVHREKGIVSFHSVGVCTITARSYNGRTATATVVVKDPALKPIDQGTQVGHFQVGYASAYLSTGTDGRFEPDRTLTRGELAQLLAQFCVYGEEDSTGGKEFADLEGRSYADAVLLLAGKGIVEGVGQEFQGDRPATRAEMAAMLARMLCLELPERESGFHAFLDAGPKDTWAWAYIDALAAEKLTMGVGDGLFAPSRTITYAEVAVFLDRVVRRNAPTGESVVLPADVPQDYWAYESIIKGLNTPPPVEESPARN